MAKHAVPKQKQSKGRSSRRYKTFANKARIKLVGMAKSAMRSAEKAQKLARTQAASTKAATKVKTIKAE